uniref:Coiled-coil domain containing 13 n=1 Tax=Cyanoderma ruficeps TaxID=181631 RepID=A0A8C3P083_9PASS
MGWEVPQRSLQLCAVGISGHPPLSAFPQDLDSSSEKTSLLSFLEAENKQLQDRLREVRDENCRLYKLVSEKDFEITQLQKRVQDDRLALSGVSGLAGDVAATKIVELAKKNREMTAEFESERARVKQLNHKVKELERELQAATEKIHSLGGDAAGIKGSTLKTLEGNSAESAEAKALQEKLSAANAKVTEYRNQLQNVKQELKLTQKILAKEVGEDVNIQSLLTNSSSWRGRAQQILLLQTRVKELEHKLSQYTIRTSLLEMGEGFLECADPRKLSFQERNLLKIRSLQKEKEDSLQKLTRQHNTLQKNHEELKKKCSALKARNQTVCEEVKMLKAQIGTLLEKGKHDDELIDALLSQQQQMQEILKDLSTKENETMGQSLNSEKQNRLIAQLGNMVTERKTEIKRLEEELGQLTLLQKKSAHPHDKSGAAHPPPPEHSGSGSSQAGRTESARIVSTMGHTLVESAATEPFFLGDATSSERSAGTDGSAWEELLGESTEENILDLVAEVGRNKFLELVAVLNNRGEESSHKVLEAEKNLHEEQWQSDMLEQQLDPGSSTSAQNPSLSSTKEPPAQPSPILCVSDSEELPAALVHLPLPSQAEELILRLGIQLDENKDLKALLEETLRERGDDLKLCQVLVEQLRDKFSQDIQQHKQEES